ncbi:hypothetical protein [Paenibacillus sp. QZ-Y1]
MAKKKQAFKHDPESLSNKAVWLRIEGKWTYPAISEPLGCMM